jgi:DnaK suppressor protein
MAKELKKALHKGLFVEEMTGGLRKELERLEGNLESMAREGNDQANVGGETEEDLVDSLTTSTVQMSLKTALEKELRDVYKALERVEEGLYGICKYCDALIEEDRLRARPTSSSCITCKKTLTDEA